MLYLTEELPETIEVEDEDFGESFHQKTVYRSLPDACFHCHERGHLIHNCPLRRPRRNGANQDKGTELQSQAVVPATGGNTGTSPGTDGFAAVAGAKQRTKGRTSNVNTNCFSALSTLDEEESADTQEISQAAVPFGSITPNVLTGNNMVLQGDWNSVETPEDSIGESPVQIDGKRRRWQNFTAHQHLEDSWIAASSREGLHFTRQQKEFYDREKRNLLEVQLGCPEGSRSQREDDPTVERKRSARGGPAEELGLEMEQCQENFDTSRKDKEKERRKATERLENLGQARKRVVENRNHEPDPILDAIETEIQS
ncbi:hypothetical protein R1sor_005958 [Riccia sorocarpa]|uniref:CCHC-type domain-containing protein n=1 Tax=Riccia sorocarpa TaxID=122646 RepID=A0ABD3HPK3_9MARC